MSFAAGGQGHLVSPVRIDPARAKEAEQAVDRQLAEAAKGADANFSERDLELVNAFRAAASAQDAAKVANATTLRPKYINANRYQEVSAAASRIVVSFNDTGGSEFTRADQDLMTAFQMALLACEALKRTAAKNVKGVRAELVAAASSSAPRVVAEFNVRGSDASYNADDVQALRDFHDALPGKKP